MDPSTPRTSAFATETNGRIHPFRKLLVTVVCGLLLAACDNFAPTGAGGASKRDDTLVIAVIPPSTSGWYWQSFGRGIEAAKQEFTEQGIPLDVAIRGPLRDEDSTYQNEATRDFIARGITGMVVAPVDARSLASTLQESLTVNLPVVIVGHPFSETHTLCRILTDEYELGQQAAGALVHLFNGNDGIVTLFGTSPSDVDTGLRVRGFLDQLSLLSPTTLILSTNWVDGTQRPLLYRAASDALAELSLHTNLIQSVFCPDDSATLIMSLARKNGESLVQSTRLVGCGQTQKSLAALQRGEIDALGIPQPSLLGREALSAIVQHLRKQPVPREIRCPGFLLTPENLATEPARTILDPPPLDR